jgi:hypothetical protein
MNLKTKTGTNNRYYRAALFGVISAFFVCVIGFGVMSVFWYFSKDVYKGMYTFPYYRAATWGDGLFLPILVGSLTGYLSLFNKPRKIYVVWSHIAGTFSALIAGYMQYTWLAKESTVHNWTLPQSHQFNAAGWYHAVYFCFMFYLVTMLFVKWILVRRQASKADGYCQENANPIYMIWRILILLGISGYIFMNSIDDRFTVENYNWYILAVYLFLMVMACIISVFSNSTHA